MKNNLNESKFCRLTPAKEGVVPETELVKEEGPDDHGVQIQSFHQHPEEIRHHQIIEYRHHCLANDLQESEVLQNF